MKAKLVVLMILLVAMMGCNALEKGTLSATRLVIKNITGNDVAGKAGSSIIFSDVLSGTGSIANDNATIDVTAALLDGTTEKTTFYPNVVIDQVDIKYSRTDGRNVEGKDVPYGFSQPVSIYVEVGATVQFSVVVLSPNAKQESPLLELRDLGQEKILQLNANLTIYAKDMAGKRLEPVSRTVTIFCCNFADAAT